MWVCRYVDVSVIFSVHQRCEKRAAALGSGIVAYVIALITRFSRLSKEGGPQAPVQGTLMVVSLTPTSLAEDDIPHLSSIQSRCILRPILILLLLYESISLCNHTKATEKC